VSPVHQVFPARYPAVEDLSAFARRGNSHGAYAVEVQLRDLGGGVLWRRQMEQPFETHDPLQVWLLTLRHLHFRTPGPGRYEVARRPVRGRWRSAHARTCSGVSVGARAWLRAPRRRSSSPASEPPGFRPRSPSRRAAWMAAQLSPGAPTTGPDLWVGQRPVRR